MPAGGRAGGQASRQVARSVPFRSIFILLVRPYMHACVINAPQACRPAGMQADGQMGASVYWRASVYAYMCTWLYLDLQFRRLDSSPLE